MLRKTLSRPIAATPVALMSTWALFVKRNAVKGQSVIATMPAIKAKWSALTPAEKEELAKDAKALPKSTPKRKKGGDKKATKKKRAARPPSAYISFVREQMPTLTGPVTERMRIIAKRWAEKQAAAGAAAPAATATPAAAPTTPAAAPTA